MRLFTEHRLTFRVVDPNLVKYNARSSQTAPTAPYLRGAAPATVETYLDSSGKDTRTMVGSQPVDGTGSLTKKTVTGPIGEFNNGGFTVAPPEQTPGGINYTPTPSSSPVVPTPAKGTAESLVANASRRRDERLKARGFIDTANLQKNNQAGMMETDEQFNARKASIEAHNTELLKQDQMTTAEKTPPPQVTPPTATPTIPSADTKPTEAAPAPTIDPATQSRIDQIRSLAAGNPDFAPLAAQLEDLVRSQSTAGLDAQMNNELASFDAEDQNRDGVADGVQSSVSESKKLLTEEKGKTNAINEKNKDIALETASIAKEMAEIGKKQFQVKQLAAENAQREANIESEIRNRRVLNKLGGASDMNGIKWMQDEIRKGNDALNELSSMGSLTEATYNLAIGREYNNNVKSALNDWDATQLQIDSNFRKDLGDLDKVVSLNAKERREERQKIVDKFMEKKDKADERSFNLVKDATMKMMDQMAATRKAKEDATIDDGDAIDFGLKIQDRVNGLQEVKSFNTVAFNYKGMTAAQETYKNDPATKPAFDTALVKLYEKILDPTSVVRQEEFESNLRAQGITRAKVQGFIDAFYGGQGLDPAMQKALVDMSSSLYESAKKNTLESIQPSLAQLKRFNSQDGANVKLEEVLNQDMIDALDIPVDEFEAAEVSIGDELPYDPQTPSDFGSWLTTTGNGQVVAGSPYHTGADQFAIDIDGNDGDPIRPPVNGVVVSATDKDKGGYGISVVIRDAEGNEHLFGHMAGLNVKVGQKVSPNMLLGTMGHTGKVIAGEHGNGSHLHYRVTKNGRPVAVQPKTVAQNTSHVN